MSTITSEFTKEQLIEHFTRQLDQFHRLIKAQPLGDNTYNQKTITAMEIALASLEAEAVAYIIQDADARSRGEKGILRYFANISDEDINEYQITVTPLYTAPPVPVSVPDAMANDIDSDDHPLLWSYNNGWNACRAAMLQSFGNSEQLNSPVIPDDWVACSERMPEVGGLYLCYVQDEYEFDISHFCFEYLAAHKKFDSAGINITHWMPLPAAPQQEVK